jgi:hypothetical protein
MPIKYGVSYLHLRELPPLHRHKCCCSSNDQLRGTTFQSRPHMITGCCKAAQPSSCAIFFTQPRAWLISVGFIGELLIGGLIFGWNAMSVMLKGMGIYDDSCPAAPAMGKDGCASQDAKLAIVWNAGVFAVNFGPALVGLALDTVGPRIVATGGAACTVGGLLLMGAPFSICHQQWYVSSSGWWLVLAVYASHHEYAFPTIRDMH